MASKADLESSDSNKSDKVPVSEAQKLKLSDGSDEINRKRRREDSEQQQQQQESCSMVEPQVGSSTTWLTTSHNLTGLPSATGSIIIRPTSRLPADRSSFSLGLGDFHGAAASGGLGKPGISSDSTRVSDLGRRSFVEWRPESAAAPFRPSAMQLPSWNTSNSALNHFFNRPNMFGNISLTQQGQWPGTTPLATSTFPACQERHFFGPTSGTTSGPSIPISMEGRSIDGGINLRDYQDYRGFAAALRNMFQVPDASQEECNLANAVPGHIIAYEDAEGDLLLAGDLPWRDFVRVARSLKILPAKGRNIVAVP